MDIQRAFDHCSMQAGLRSEVVVDRPSAFIGYLRDVMQPRHFAEFIAVLEQRRMQQQPFPIPLMLLYASQDPLVPPVVGERLELGGALGIAILGSGSYG
ncbi:hypothetical protein ACRCUN_10840 [Mycobacterium sp. LTG2003]